jgi:hypothetical protein
MNRPWQFSLSSLMLATAALSGAAALFARFGGYATIILSIVCPLALSISAWRRGSSGWATIGVCSFVVALLASVPLSSVMIWDGEKTISLTITVFDAANKQPLSGVAVRLRENDWLPQKSTPPDRSAVAGSTAFNGSVALPWTFGTSGHEGYFEHNGHIHFGAGNLWIEASSPGYATQLVELESITGKSRDISDPIPPPMQIFLLRQATAEKTH